jgi:hypothetical protein
MLSEWARGIARQMGGWMAMIQLTSVRPPGELPVICQRLLYA